MQPELRSNLIVVGIDYSPASGRALDAAIAAAREWQSRVALVHAIKPLAAPGLDPAHPDTDPRDNETADLGSTPGTPAPEEWVRRVEDAGLEVEMVSRAGDPVDVLVEEAERLDARAIVVATHGRGGFVQGILGSVAEGVLAASPVPVLVVPSGPDGLEQDR